MRPLIHLSLSLLIGLSASTSISIHAQSTTPSQFHARSQRQLKEQTAVAHSPKQYRALAIYFREQEATFRAQATGEKTEWERRKQINVSIFAKSPAPADSARNLYDYYNYKADQMANRAIEYEKRAASVRSVGGGSA
jgi:hypothetical protein